MPRDADSFPGPEANFKILFFDDRFFMIFTPSIGSIARTKMASAIFSLLETILNKLGYNCLCSGVDNKLQIYFLKKIKKNSSDVIEKISNITKINKSVFEVRFIDKFPRNQFGKILYNKLN